MIDPSLNIKSSSATELPLPKTEWDTLVDTEGLFGSNQTIKPSLPEEAREQRFTTVPEEEEQKISTISFKESPYHDTYSISKPYLEFNTEILIRKIIIELKIWEESNTRDVLPHIASIKDLLDQQREYLYKKSENRVLLSLLELIFKNNNWENFQPQQIKMFREELSQFVYGEVGQRELDIFAKRLFRQKISIMKSKDDEKKEKQE